MGPSRPARSLRRSERALRLSAFSWVFSCIRASYSSGLSMSPDEISL